MRLIGPRNGIGMLKLIVLIMAGMMLGGALFYGWSKHRGGEDGSETEASQPTAEEEARATTTLSLGEFLVNLRSSESTLRYLQTEVSIVVTTDHDDSGKDAGGYKKAEDEEPSLPPASHRYARDVAISVLSSQSFERLRDEPDRSKLKALLQQELDSALQAYQVRDVLFTAFVMQ